MTSSQEHFAHQGEWTESEARTASPRPRRCRVATNAIGLALMLLSAMPARGETPKRPEQRQATPARPAAVLKATGRRDPFKLPAPATPAGGTSQTRAVNMPPPGRRGLLIGDLQLNGVVREENSHSMIALVTGNSKLTYFLHENDLLYDGKVVRITPDSIELRQNYLDPDGEVRSRQVIKRLIPQGGTGGEGQ